MLKKKPKSELQPGGRGDSSFRWMRIKKSGKKASLAALNMALFADPKALLAWGEENTRLLTGQARI